MISGLNGLAGLGRSGTSFESALGALPVKTTEMPSVQGSFASVLGSMATNAIGNLKGAEHVSLNALQGDVDTRQVVDAVMEAEQSLQAAIAIRDKIVTAYLEISRMAI